MRKCQTLKTTSLNRRSVLRSGVAAGSLLLPWSCGLAWGQSEAALKLARSPKVALVIGNGNYKGVPALRNPANDALAMTNTLKAAGFEVTMKLHASREEMIAQIVRHVHTLEAKKCVGLFYFAGHGLQLAWRNYLLPVDATINNLADISTNGVDIDTLTQGIAKARNLLNVIVLDACRQNPFGHFRVEQNGLSQMEAPPNTFLAYATAPGNVASDGEGVNGLYTENLLREIQVKDAKIEDVFKRVRLSVRRTTNGAQIPWESTSLEEDFYFLPPENLKRLSNEIKVNLFKEEREEWDRIKASRNVDDFYQYLQKYPTGSISEHAQFRLDQLQMPQVEASVGPSGIKLLPSGVSRYAVGDEFTYENIDRFSKASNRSVSRVTTATEDRVEFNNGTSVTDQMGGTLRDKWGTKSPSNLIAPADIGLGKRWRSAFMNTRPDGVVESIVIDNRVVAMEEVRVPAGEFRAFKVNRYGWATWPRGTTRIAGTRWIDPTTMLAVRIDNEWRDGRGQLVEYTSSQLVSVKRAQR